jgi:hypothetical protein
MERHAGKNVMNPQWQPLELSRRDLWHRVSQSGPAGAGATYPPPRGQPRRWSTATVMG